MMEQGQSNVRPKFRVKNEGSRTYTSVSVLYGLPKGVDRYGKEVKLLFNMSSPFTTILEPGEEKILISADPFLHNLKFSLNQAIATYSSECRIKFSDKEKNLYRSPTRKIREFVRVVPPGNDVVLLDYKPVVLEQGAGQISPVFPLKNIGSQAYTSVLMKFKDSEFTSTEGERRTLSIFPFAYLKIKRVEPGEKVLFKANPDSKWVLHISSELPKGVYSMKYRLEYMDTKGTRYTTPLHEIKEFIRVTSR